MIEITEEKLKIYAEKSGLDIETAKKSLYSFCERLDEHERKMNYVSSIEYLDWLFNFIQPDEVIDDESAYYDMEEGKDKENVMLFSILQEVISELAEEQDVPNILDEDNSFQAYNYIFQYKDKFFRIDTVVGQGSITFVSQVQSDNIDRKVVLA